MASQKMRIDTKTLTKLLTDLDPGHILSLEKSPAGVFIVAETTPKTKTQLLSEPPYAPLRGQGLTITQASRKYDVPRGTINRWIYNQSYISFADEECYPKLIDEAEVALCAEIYHTRRANGLTKGGAAYFDDDDYPVMSHQDLKHPQLSADRRRKKAK